MGGKGRFDMSPTEVEIISQMESLIKFEFDRQKTSTVDLIGWANNILDLIKLILPPKCSQILSLEKTIEQFISEDFFKDRYRVKLFTIFQGFLMATYSDFKNGFIKDLRTEIRAEVDANFLAQAHRIIAEELKDPAAMLIGAVLEDALRQLCKKFGVQEGTNIESMNSPLKKEGVYGLPDQQQVTAWAAIRNKADHGHFDEYDLQQVKSMHQGVSAFVAKYLT